METIHDFIGHHLIANYSGCDYDALTNLEGLRDALCRGIAATGATILSANEHVFDGNGFTMMFLLSESHASIHTYPEYASCFIDIFTCGLECKPEEFGRVMEEYLCPTNSSKKMLVRDEGIKKISACL